MPPKRKGAQKPVTVGEKAVIPIDGSNESPQEEKDEKPLQEVKKPARANKRKQKDDKTGAIASSDQIQDELPIEPGKRVRGKKKDVEKLQDSEIADNEKGVRKGRGRVVKENKVADDIQKPVRGSKKRANEEKPPEAKVKKSKVPNAKNKKDQINETTPTTIEEAVGEEHEEETKKLGRRGKKVVEQENVEQEKVPKGRGGRGSNQKDYGEDGTAKLVRGRKNTAKIENIRVEKPKMSSGKNKKSKDEMISENQQPDESTIVPVNKKTTRLSKKIIATKAKRGKRLSK